MVDHAFEVWSDEGGDGGRRGGGDGDESVGVGGGGAEEAAGAGTECGSGDSAEFADVAGVVDVMVARDVDGARGGL